jgi:hypothetical protein
VGCWLGCCATLVRVSEMWGCLVGHKMEKMRGWGDVFVGYEHGDMRVGEDDSGKEDCVRNEGLRR